MSETTTRSLDLEDSRDATVERNDQEAGLENYTLPGETVDPNDPEVIEQQERFAEKLEAAQSLAREIVAKAVIIDFSQYQL